MAKTILTTGHGVITRLSRQLGDHFPFTVQGMTILVVALTSLYLFGYRRMDLVVFSLTICALAILGFSLLSTFISGLLLRRRINHMNPRSRQPISNPAEAGYPSETGFSIHAMNWLPLVSLQWQIRHPDQIETRLRFAQDTRADDNGPTRTLIEEQILPARRCRSASIKRLFTVRDVLGLCRFSWLHTQDSALLVLPRTGELKALPLLRSLSAEDGLPNPSGEPEGDRLEIRPYAPGDPVKNILWRAYARSRQLNVRVPENSVSHSDRTLAYLIAGEDPAISDEAAAAVARVALESGALGEEWLFGADGSDYTADTVRAALPMIAGSRALNGTLPCGLAAFLTENALGSRAHCMVFASLQGGDWLAAIRQMRTRFNGRISVILAVDGLHDTEPLSQLTPLQRWRRRLKALLLRPDDNDQAKGHSVSEIRRFLGDLQPLVESVVIVDRSTGLSFDRQLKAH